MDICSDWEIGSLLSLQQSARCSTYGASAVQEISGLLCGLRVSREGVQLCLALHHAEATALEGQRQLAGQGFRRSAPQLAKV